MSRNILPFVVACAATFVMSPVASAQLLFQENFDSLLPSLGPSVNERVGTGLSTITADTEGSTAVSGVWSNTAPGWTVDNTLATYDGGPTLTTGVPGAGVADYGVDEWEGWTFPRVDFWSTVDGQDRGNFATDSGASGVIAVVDPDEYFDLGGPGDETNGGYFNSAMTGPSFPVAAGSFYGVGFDSSWRDEAFDDSAPGIEGDQNNQAIELLAIFDNGDPVQITKWNSDSTDPFFKDDAAGETRLSDGTDLVFEAPAGASTASLSFRIANAGNDWWWAVDNIKVDDLSGGAGTVFSEDFEGVTLGDSVNERILSGSRVTIEKTGVSTVLDSEFPTQGREGSFTHTPPAGWSVNNDGTPNTGDDDIGVFEWEQWSFATPDFWTFADRQDRQDFGGTGVIAIADGDEWDDLADPGDNGDLTTLMQTPEFDISTASEGVILSFDSSWRDEDGQTAIITAILDGTELEVLRWNSDDTSEFFHDDNPNEAVEVMIDTAGASTMQLSFTYIGNNDWWWAVDNIEVSAVPEPATFVPCCLALLSLFGFRRRQR